MLAPLDNMADINLPSFTRICFHFPLGNDNIVVLYHGGYGDRMYQKIKNL